MKIFGIETDIKYITFQLDNVKYMISFRITPLKGIHDVYLGEGDSSETCGGYESYGGKPIKTESTPPVIQGLLSELKWKILRYFR